MHGQAGDEHVDHRADGQHEGSGAQTGRAAEQQAGDEYGGLDDRPSGAQRQAALVEAHHDPVARAGTGSGTVTSSSGGISCGSTCTASYTANTVVTLTAAASALTGKITDPRTMGNYPAIEYPDHFTYKTEWFIEPARKSSDVALIKGPNIQAIPQFEALPETLECEVIIKVGDNISTDIIMPAGNKALPFRSNIIKISEFVFENIDEKFHERAIEKGSGVVVGGENYGQGSSREHAALAPRFLGIKAKIVKSFARIHKDNLIDFGILPLVFKDKTDYDAIRQGDKIRFADIKKHLENNLEEIPVEIDGRKIITILDVSERQRKILIAGGILNLARSTK